MHPGSGTKGVLIGGSSHCGKSTLAQALGDALGWRVGSTDRLGRHPGRPWPSIPGPVEEFYDTLSDDTIYWFLRVHHTNFWPLLTRTIDEERATGGGFVLEGSALRPENVDTLDDPGLIGIYLHADGDFLAERMRRESGYADRDAVQQRRIDRFITRSLRDNGEIRDAATAHGLRLIEVADGAAFAQATEQLIQELQP